MTAHRVAAVLVDSIGTEHPCTSVRLTVDETWSPRQQAEVVVPVTSDWWVTPGDRLTLRLVDSRPSGALSDVSADLAGLTLADIAWATLADASSRYASAVPPTWFTSSTVSAVLWARSVSTDYVARNQTVTLASMEAVLNESCGRADPTYYSGQTLAAMVNQVFGEAGIFSAFPDTVYDSAFESIALPDQLGWTRTDRLFDYLSLWCSRLSLRLGVDLDGVWRVWDTAAPAASSVVLSRVFSVARTFDRDDEEFAERLSAHLSSTTSGGLDNSLDEVIPPFDDSPGAAGQSLHLKAAILDFGPVVSNSPAWPTNLDAVQLRNQRAGGSLVVEAPIDFRIRPGASLTLEEPAPIIDESGLPLGGIVQSVTWQIDEITALTTIRTRQD